MLVDAPAGADLFASEAEVFVNAVNTRGVMGAGIAAGFKLRFPDMFEEYRALCNRRGLQPGGIHVWAHAAGEPLFVVNLATKDHWRDPSRYE